MAWLELTIKTAPLGIEDVAAALTAAGFDDLLLEDQTEFEDFLEDNRAYWDYIDETLQEKLTGLSQIKLYLEDTDEKGLSQLKALLTALREKDKNGHLGSLELSENILPDTDWEESWKENYPPQALGNKLIVLPYWLADTDTQGRLPVILDPGLTFGTGAHASTRMCMEALEESVTPGCSVVDLGCGSGILSITALRLGAGHVLGVDIDEKAEDVSRENASFNGFGSDRFTAITGNVLASPAPIRARRPEGFDLVLANIVADVIIPLAPLVRELGRPGGRFICSGILVSRLREVEAALEAAHLTILSRRRSDDEWCSLTCMI